MATTRFGERVYRRLLRLYPRHFSEDYAGEMTRLYRDRAREEGAAAVWGALVMDLLRTAPKEQIATAFEDVRHAWRTWRRTPILAAVATLTLAIGVGANTAVFSVVNGLLLRPLPYPGADRLVEVFEDNTRAGGGPFFRVSLLNYLSWVERARSFDALAAFSGRDFTITEHGDPERVLGSAVTASLFDVLALRPIAGRPFAEDDERPGAAPVALLSEPLWRRAFGGDPSIVGRGIVLNDIRHEVVGIVPAAFREIGRTQIGSAGAAQVFIPLPRETDQSRGNHTLRVVGRRRPHVSLEQARVEMRGIAGGMEAEFPATNRQWGVWIEPPQRSMFDPKVRTSLLVLLGAVGAVLLIACVNVANLVLARAVGRQRELALRAALGARPSRLARQLLTESVSLALVSGACGLAMAVLSMEALGALVPATVARADEIRLDGTVLGFGLLVTTACGLFFGMTPAVRGARVNLVSALTQGGKGTLGRSRDFWRHGLVVAQTGLATMLVVLAALLLQSLARLQDVPLGFEPGGAMTTRVSLPAQKYPDAVTIAEFHRRLIDVLDASPAIRSAGVMTSAPFAPGVRRGVTLHDRSAAGGSQAAPITAGEQIVSAGLFRALGVPLLAGREFGAQDRSGSALVAIVSKGLAGRLWPHAEAVGRLIEIEGRSHEVVGVVGDLRGNDGVARGGGRERDPQPALYLASTQFPQRAVSLVVRTNAQFEAILPVIRTVFRQIDPTLPVPGARRLGEWIAESDAQPRLTATLAGTFAVVALLLTVVGIYGVIAHSVSRRTQEIGVRMALGAGRRSILGLVLGTGMTWAGGGILLGLLGAWSIAHAIASLLFDTTARDPFTFALTACALTMVAVSACVVPAIRATRIDPVTALRTD